MIERKFYIYVLIDPRNNNVFYVGYTSNPKRRLREHIKYKHNLNKDIFIDEILYCELKPEMKVIDECDYIFNEELNMYEHERLEIFYIKKYREEGVKLTNLTDGGGTMGKENSKPVFQFDEFGKYMKKYNSLTEASESVMVSISKISQALNQKINKSSAGYYWFTSMDGIKNIKYRKVAKKNISILQYSLEGKFLNKFKGQGEAEKITKVKSKLINKCLRMNGYDQAGGYMWFYENNVPEEIIKYRENRTRKSISQYDLNGNLIANYNSITEAAKILTITVGLITTNLKHKTKMCKGYMFTYINEKPKKYIVERKLYVKAVLKFDVNGMFLNEYVSIKEASKINNVQRTSISANLNGKYKTAGGYIWKYKNNMINN